MGMDLPLMLCKRLNCSDGGSRRPAVGIKTSSSGNGLLASITVKTPPIINFLILALIVSPAPSFADVATMKLVEELTATWLREVEALDSSCQLGRKANKDALSFWNPYLGNERVKYFSNDTEELKQYVDTPEQLRDKDTVSAFADAKEAGLLRAMRKHCPDVW